MYAYACGCNPSLGSSCFACDGSAPEWREASRAARAGEREREAAMHTPEGRAAWLATWPVGRQADMAASADRQYGEVATLRLPVVSAA